MKDFSPLAITSAVVGFPARIGVITRMDGTIIRFSESDIPITVSGDTFAVVPGLQVSAVKHTSNGEVPSCQIVGVYGDTFYADDLDVGLFDGAAVEIYIVDRLNLTRKGLQFSGAVSNISVDPIERLVSFDVKGPASIARRIMTRKRQPMCQTDWSSTLCGINAASYAVSATVATKVSAFVFTVSGLTNPDGWFNNGEALTANGVAFELGSWVQSTQTFIAYLPCERILTVGMGLTLWPGCDKTLSATSGCNKFTIADPTGNHLNYQGEPHFLGTAAAAQQV